METEQPTAKKQIHNIGFLDLRSYKTAEDLGNIASIHNVGVVLVPESLAGALSKIEMSDIGSVVSIPDGENVACMMGQTKLTGEALEKGNAESILVLVGQTFITSACQSVGYKEIRVHGQLFATCGSEAAIGAKLTHLSGQNFYLPENPRFVMGDLDITAEYLQLLPGSTPFVVMGSLSFDEDVSVELVKSKISEIVLMGEIQAPKRLLALLEVLTSEKMGTIRAIDGSA